MTNEPLPIQPATCAECQHGAKVETPRQLMIACHRYPPQIVGPNYEPVFPLLNPIQHCGEFSPAFDVARDMAG